MKRNLSNKPASRFFSPQNLTLDQALSQARVVGIGAHQDDLEFMCLHALQQPAFFGIVVTDGVGSARGSEFAGLSNEAFGELRAQEQEAAAKTGQYLGVLQLGYSSQKIKSGFHGPLLTELRDVLVHTKTNSIYTHNLTDRHLSHVAVASHVIAVLRKLPRKNQPSKLFGCEVWGGLDWLPGKILQDVTAGENLGRQLMTIFQTQIRGSKNYPEAVIGRKKANATFADSHSKDRAQLMEYAMDMTKLLKNPKLNTRKFCAEQIQAFEKQVLKSLSKFQAKVKG
jgi:LmbE family N-acetylglucosaminyl deacetylase